MSTIAVTVRSRAQKRGVEVGIVVRIEVRVKRVKRVVLSARSDHARLNRCGGKRGKETLHSFFEFNLTRGGREIYIAFISFNCQL